MKEHNVKRTIQVVAGLGLAGAVLLGGAASASAGTGHHKHATKSECQVAKRCRPAPLTPPPGGWPCAKDHSCSTRHHYPVCPPTKPPVKPPHSKPPKHHRPPFVAHPVPPVVHNAPKPVTPQRVTAASPQLPRTGGTSLPLAFAGGAFVLGGAALKRLARAR